MTNRGDAESLLFDEECSLDSPFIDSEEIECFDAERFLSGS